MTSRQFYDIETCVREAKILVNLHLKLKEDMKRIDKIGAKALNDLYIAEKKNERYELWIKMLLCGDCDIDDMRDDAGFENLMTERENQKLTERVKFGTNWVFKEHCETCEFEKENMTDWWRDEQSGKYCKECDVINVINEYKNTTKNM